MCENSSSSAKAMYFSQTNDATRDDCFAYTSDDSEYEDAYEEIYDEHLYEDPFELCFEMSGSMTEVLGSTPRMGRRSMALADIDPKYVSQSGIWEPSEVETPRGGSIRIQHLTSISGAGPRPLSTTSGASVAHGSSSIVCPSITSSRFPKLEECAHFHYDILELPVLKITLREELLLKSSSTSTCTSSSATGNDDEITPAAVVGGGDSDKCYFSIEVVSGGQCWLIRRTHANLIKLDEQLHRCVWDRHFSKLEPLSSSPEDQQRHTVCKRLVDRYLERLSQLPTNQITCGTVLSWFEIDNRGRHIISSDDSALNTPAVGAGLAIRTYVAQAPDELSFKVGELISVIDMPPPEESLWLRGKLTRESLDTGINFEVGFFPRECVEIIGEKGKFQGGVKPVVTTRRLARVSVSSAASSPIPDKPVLRKHGKIISFFRSMMSRPEKHVLQQKGILRERVFNCDLAEHLLNTGTDIPVILKSCAEFIELFGISDGIYRVSGSLRNTQRLRRLFDAEEVPNLEEDENIRQDVHAVSSLLKQYFRELPNPLCTYQLYEKFVLAISPPSNKERFDNIKDVIKQLPPPHYRTLEYLMLHLNKMTIYAENTGMTAQNMAIVWAPNLIRCRDLEGGSVAEFKGVSNHVIVTEFVIRYAERFFGKDKTPLPSTSEGSHSLSGRPESLSLSSSSPMKLMSLEAAKEKLRDGRNYIEVGGGPSSLPPVYHTVIDPSKRRASLKSKSSAGGSPAGWRNFFSRNRSFSKSPRKTTAADIRVVMNTAVSVKDGGMSTLANKLRPVKSVESLVSTPSYSSHLAPGGKNCLENTLEVDESATDVEEAPRCTSSPATPVADPHSQFHCCTQPEAPSIALHPDNSKTHNRSISHDSYFEANLKKTVLMTSATLEEESSVSGSRLSLDLSSGAETSPQKERSSGAFGDCESNSSRATRNRSSFGSPLTPPPSMSSLRPHDLPISEGINSSSSDDFSQSRHHHEDMDETTLLNSPLLRPKAKPRLSKLRDCQVQTSLTRMNDVGVSTSDEGMSTVNVRDASSGISVPLTDKAASHRDPEAINMALFQYPTFPESARNVRTSSLHRRYELDRNSSVDDSSTDTTPGGDPYSVTNIVYSPLVNDISSQASSPDIEEKYVPSFGITIPVPASNVFVCPLFEYNSSERRDGAQPAEEPTYENTVRRNLHQYDNVNTVAVTHSAEEPSHNDYENEPEDQLTPINHYENEQEGQSTPIRYYENQKENQPCQISRYENETQKHPAPISHYENENQHAPISHCEKENQSVPVNYYENEPVYQNDIMSTPSPDTETTLEPTAESEQPAVFPENWQYTNIPDDSESVLKELKGENLYETNVYEDIDDDESILGKNSYEDIESSLIGGPAAKAQDMSPNALYQAEASESDSEAAYESVQFSSHKNRETEDLLNHHYTEIIEITNTSESNVPSSCSMDSMKTECSFLSSTSASEEDESARSASKTEDTITCLEIVSSSISKFNDSGIEKPADESISCSSNASPTTDDDSIRHIDSPLMVDNPLYGIQLEDTAETLSEEVQRMSVEFNNEINLENTSAERAVVRNPEKLVGRCNSAPLADSSPDFALSVSKRSEVDLSKDTNKKHTLSAGLEDDESDLNRNNDSMLSRGSQKLLLCKRLSEPSLNLSKTEERTSSTSCWKYPDAKRLTHRKQSVKELLTRFESQEGMSLSPAQSPTRSSPVVLGTGNSPTPSVLPGPGLPRPNCKYSSNNNNYESSTCLRDRNSSRFPHHRFSMGDILMSQSMNSTEEGNSFKQEPGLMTRSDTFPELRNESSKENESSCRLTYPDNKRFIVPEKVLQVFEVANTTVDNNDPNTRERIEKYKNNRRLFLREKFSSGQMSEADSRTSVTSTKSSHQTESSTSIDTDCVFRAGQVTPEETRKLPTSDSPRKRALSEDVCLHNKNQFKAFKSEEEPKETCAVSIKDKSLSRSSRMSEVISTRACESVIHPQLGTSSRLNIKSLPVGLREEVISITTTVTTVEVPVKVPWSPPARPAATTAESGKKIRDIAAFFEKKQF